VVAVALATALPASAQQNWDPDAYLGLVEQGEDLYREALSIPESEVERRRTLLFESARIKQRALSLLRNALVANRVTEYRAEAIADYFNLNENLIIILIALEQCAAAELLLDQSQNATTLIAEAGDPDLSGLVERVDECADAAGLTAVVWDSGPYQEMMSEGVLLYEDAMDLPAADRAGREQYFYDSMRLTEAALIALRQGIRSGDADERLADPEQEHVDGTRQIIVSMLELDLCSVAEGRLQQALDDDAYLPSDGEAQLARLQDAIEECEERVAERSVVVQETVIVESGGMSGRDIAGWSLIGAAGAATMGFFVIDLVMADEVDDLDALRAQCETGRCNGAQAQSLANSVDDARLGQWILLGTAVATGATGLILLVTGDDDAESERAARVAPIVAPGLVGAGFDLSF